MPDRRHVDWSYLSEADGPLPTSQDGCASTDLSSLLAAFDEMITCDDVDLILRRAVEVGRLRIGLKRVAIFLRDEPNGVMRGTWGTDLDGNTVDEHFITFDLPPNDKETQERNLRNGVHWTVVDHAPLVVHLPSETRVVGRGWVCCTPIRSGLELLGMMFNDEGLSGAPVDNAKQAQGAVLCSLLGTALEVAQRRGHSLESTRTPARSPVVVKAARLLTKDPALTADELGAELKLSASRMARLFKNEMGMSLVEYRNRLRLERFFTLLDQRGENLLAAALEAGFGSYAQFHRAFSTLRGTTPGKFLRSRAARQK